ncbi:MAG TPA: FAD/NAD(P)-binding protein, partial [Candidatus Saccharimonadales bacterium]|nr:FAD/NAD(P)-binding protein [Candidatus Saccharimonadales bacterium]
MTTKTFAIIGTGVTGTSALIALARQLRKHKEKNDTLPPIKIITVEKRHTNGPGYPYDPVGAHGAHLLNHPAAEMALKPVDERGKDKQADFEVAGWHSHDFVLWLKAHKSDILDKHPDSVKATQVDADPSVWTPRLDGHYSRGLFGLYAQDRFREAAAELRQLGVTVIQYTDTEVVAAQRQGHYLTLTLKDLQTGRLSKVKADKVLIATGRWTRQISSELKTTRWFEKPYPAS